VGKDKLVNLLVECVPVAHGSVQCPNVDEVKTVMAAGPGVGASVVDFELEVWRNPSGLGGREIADGGKDVVSAVSNA
jgi:hypothetical protein